MAIVREFFNTRTDAVIHVPAASLDAYNSATNWSVSTFVSKMVGDL